MGDSYFYVNVRFKKQSLGSAGSKYKAPATSDLNELVIYFGAVRDFSQH